MKREPVLRYSGQLYGDFYDMFWFWIPYPSIALLQSWIAQYYPIQRKRAMECFKNSLAIQIAAINELIPATYFFFYNKLQYVLNNNTKQNKNQD
jgi:hypothetical protein